MTDGSLTSSYWVTNEYWSQTYKTIVTCNNFLDHIDDIDMDTTIKKRMIADVRTLRAYHYFYLATFWGDVPLVTTVLSMEEANSVSRTPVLIERTLKHNNLAKKTNKMDNHILLRPIPQTVIDQDSEGIEQNAGY